jgi:uncharacterized membrane protein YphA (DoxX/SURF4 family)
MIYSLFPEVLWWGALATPLLFRGALIILLFSIASTRMLRARGLPPALNGQAVWSFVWSVTAVEAVLGLLFLAGLFTQVAALLGILYGITSMLYKKKLGLLAPQTRSLYFLFAVAALSLFFTGAGPLALDLPL